MSESVHQHRLLSRLLFTALAAMLSLSAHAIVRCELNGKSVNPNNGNETAGLTGMLRCKDENTGKLQREEELRDGKNIGIQRFFDRDGNISKERTVNERGNTQGLDKQFWPNGKLKSEESADNGQTQGVTRQFHESGSIRRIAFVQNREEVLEMAFNPDGSYNDLRCATSSLVAEDRKACGFAGKSDIVLSNAAGKRRGLQTWEQGKLLVYVSYRDDGSVERDMRFEQGQRQHRSYYGSADTSHADGKPQLREERVYEAGDQTLRATQGPLLSHKQWGSSGQLTLHARYNAGRLSSTERWFLNGARKEKSSMTGSDSTTRTLRESYTDDGKLYSRETLDADNAPVGLRQFFHPNGKLAREDNYAQATNRGRARLISRKEWDESGQLTADDELLEDGSRKRKLGVTLSEPVR